MRWILIVFVAAVASLCLLCGESGTVRARRDAVEIEAQPAAPPVAHRDVETPADVPAGAGVTEEEVEEELGPTPEDPIEVGECSLFLSLTSAETGAPVGSSVKLFRLGAPGNEHWTRGDRLQASVEIPREGLWVHNLPEGLYRIHAAAQRHPSDDPFRFTVRGSVTEKQFALPMPRRFHARLVVVDEHGRPVLSGRTRRAYSSSSHREVGIPWFRARKLRHPERFNGCIGISGGSGGAYSGRRWGATEAVDGAFDLGRFYENSRGRRHTNRKRFRFEGRTEVRLGHAHEPGRDQTWMAMTVEPRMIEDMIFYPDGRLATRARVWIHADAVLVPDPAPAEFWRTLNLNVRVSLEGFEEMRFEVNPSNPPVKRYLKPEDRGRRGIVQKVSSKYVLGQNPLVFSAL